MRLYLQFGYGMMAHCRELLKRWDGASGLILSPRDLTASQLESLSKDASATGAEVLVDPQCYVRAADHHRLVNHHYWTAIQTYTTSGFLSKGGAGELLHAVAQMNSDLGTSRRIIPGLLAVDVDEDWFAFQSQLICDASGRLMRPFLATIAVGKEPMRDEAKIEAIIERAEQWDVDGYYVVAETPGPYLVDDPNWLANLLILTSGLKLQGRSVVVGYANHQGLALAAANVDAIASGTWLNVRAFGPDKFFTKDEDDVSRRARWFYCPHALSEYKIPFLDVADRLGKLADMKPRPPLPDDYCAPLFAGAQPSVVEWGETLAFRHYLDCLWSQVASARKSSFDETLDEQHRQLDQAEQVLQQLRRAGVRGNDRDFFDILDVNRSALAVHSAARAAQLRRAW